ncbi:DUF2937 family protein [Paracoccus sp. (in: a-proteobacteria)]|uniref:DUF2937 family protein n=1 Tax=Paracoccus sp. TaxID=267 RepID=UPI0026E0D81B|nr:DUF2937 family protein [Paracoccus sp. (in: a-proteobacteria)]MDO5369395.1 DUF2937 family protein [Paracoccus sp. (in: a-proteobacteria)]
MSGLFRLVVALAFALALSQFPAFSDQYVQRLGGQADALRQVAAEFDTSADRAGLTRQAALEQIAGSAFLDSHGQDMGRVFTRLARIESDLGLLRAASPLERIALPHRMRDTETIAATWGDFRPAVPLTTAGFWATGFGFLLGWFLAGLPLMLFRRGEQEA